MTTAIRTNRTVISGMNSEKRYLLEKDLTYPNPAYNNALRFGRCHPAVMGIPKTIQDWYETSDGRLSVPNGVVLSKYGIPDKDIKEARVGSPVKWPKCQLKLRDSQKAVLDISGSGVLVIPTGEGKTIAALAMAAKRGQRTLVVVHRNLLVKQWREDFLRMFPGHEEDIGIIKGNKRKIGTLLTIGMVQTMCRFDQPTFDLLKDKFGLVISDESHHAPASTFTTVVEQFPCQRIGLTATPKRKDRRHPTMFAVLGPMLFRMGESEATNIVPYQVTVHRTDFCLRVGEEEDTTRHDVVECLIRDTSRNKDICRVAKKSWECGKSVVVFTERIAHAIKLASMLRRRGCRALSMTGKLSPKDIQKRFRLADKKRRLIVTTFSLNKEGTNFPKWDCGILASPTGNQMELTQMIGRIRRTYPGKTTAEWHDIMDPKTRYLYGLFLSERSMLYQRTAAMVSEA